METNIITCDKLKEMLENLRKPVDINEILDDQENIRTGIITEWQKECKKLGISLKKVKLTN